MINYGKDARARYTKCEDKIYLRIQDADNNISFIALYDFDEFDKRLTECRRNVDMYLNGKRITYDMLKDVSGIILELNEKMMKLRATYDLIRNIDPAAEETYKEKIDNLNKDIDLMGYSFTMLVREHYPNAATNCHYDVFCVPANEEKIEQGKDVVDRYGNEYYNEKAFYYLWVQNVLAGVHKFPVSALTRLDFNDRNKNAKLEEEYQHSKEERGE